MRKCITEFCREYQYPVQAQEELCSVCDRIEQTEALREIFRRAAEEYESNPYMNYRGYLDGLKAACREEGVCWESASLLFFICLVPGLARHYERRGLPRQLLRAGMEDLKWKLRECRQVYGVWGTFVSDWFEGFFRLTRFTLGRLQFELLPFPEDYVGAGRVRPEEADKVINMHIPSSGPLFHEECVRSYKLAAEFFGKEFPGGECVFFCDSWLLYPRHREFLPAGSRILEFMGDFDIYKSEENAGGDLWRIFGTADCSGYVGLPEKTSLQRAYKKWLLSGGKPGTGTGIFLRKK